MLPPLKMERSMSMDESLKYMIILPSESRLIESPTPGIVLRHFQHVWFAVLD
ncbi:hypothetical protein V6Z11_A11G038800 [Gossypium hirsutum]